MHSYILNISFTQTHFVYYRFLQDDISVNPVVTIPLFLFIRNATWYALVGGFTYFAIGGPEFAIAYLASKVTMKFRQPLNLPLAALFAKTFPLLGQVKASALLYIPLPPDDGATSEKSSLKKEENKGILEKLSAWTMAPLDKYGFSFYVASKLTVFLTIGCTALLIREGVDVSDWLESWGVSSAMQDVGGAAGLASMVNVGLIPGQLFAVGRLTPAVNLMLKGRMGTKSSSANTTLDK